jgi:hypothetical protein
MQNLAQTAPFMAAKPLPSIDPESETEFIKRSEPAAGSSDLPDYPEPYHGIKGQRVKKVVLSSLNGTNGTDGADFTVNVETASIFNLRVSSMTLADVSFPGGQFLFEEEWNRVDFAEGIRTLPSFRTLNIEFRDTTYVVTLPLFRNAITGVTRLSSTVYQIITEDEIGSYLTPSQNGMSILANRFSVGGKLLLGTEYATLQNDPDNKNSTIITFTSDDGLLDPPSDTCLYGTLAMDPFSGPAHFVQILNDTIRGTRPNDADDAVRFSLTFSWDPEIDTFSVAFSSDEYPTLSGDLLPYMGFRNGLVLDPSDKTEFSSIFKASGTRSNNPNSGTRVRVGTYASGNDIATAWSAAFNGAWFGRSDSAVDAGGPWQLTVRGPTSVPFTICVPPGRYTPQQLASTISHAFEYGITTVAGSCSVTGLDVPIRARAVMDSSTYRGISFHCISDPPTPFDLILSPGGGTTIDPAKLGYDTIDYAGSCYYVPDCVPPYYPTIFQGSTLFETPPTQNYTVAHRGAENRLQVTTSPFRSRVGEVLGTTDASGCQLLILQLNMAHGCTSGQQVYLSKGVALGAFSQTYSGVVYVPEPGDDYTDPTMLYVVWGGSTTWALGDLVNITFASPGTWFLNASHSCLGCINREVVGLDAAFYSFSKHLTFRLPNLINMIPFKYVFCVITLNNAQGSGNTLAIQTSKWPGSKESGGLITAIGRILIGPRNPDAASELYDRLFETMMTSTPYSAYI